MAFKFSDMVTMDKTLNLLAFRDHASIFKVTGGYYVSSFTLFAQYFGQFSTDGFQILRYSDLELMNCLNFQGQGYYASTFTLFVQYFSGNVFANIFQMFRYGDHEQDLAFSSFL